MDLPEPDATAPVEAKVRAHLQRFCHRAIAVSLLQVGTPGREEAIRECAAELERLRPLRPDSGAVLMNLHWACARLGENDRAAAVRAEFVRSACKEAQPVAYFARELSTAGDYAGALELLNRAPELGDYLGDEIGLERMRAHAGLKDARGAVASFTQRIESLESDLDQFHFAYHVALAADQPTGPLAELYRAPEQLERELKARLEGPGGRMIHALTLAGLYNRLGRIDDQVELLRASVDKYKGVAGFRHYLYRTAYRLLEAGGRDKPD